MILLKVSSDGAAVESSTVDFTYRSRFRYKKRKPQKVSPKPMKARMEEAYTIEKIRASIPMRARM